MVTAFAGLPNSESDRQSAKAVVIPVAFEVNPNSGTAQGPRAILDASQKIEHFDAELCIDPCRIGIATTEYFWDEAPFAHTEKMVGEVLDAGKFPIVLGGEHPLTLGAVRACWKRHPDLAVVQIGACANLRDDQDDPHAHASTMARIKDYHLPVVQVGIRSLSSSEMKWLDSRAGESHQVFWAKDFVQHTSGPSWDVADVVAAVPARPVYVTIGLDGLDPAILPATTTSEPGGLSWYALIKLMRALMTTHDVIACDLMGLAPIPGSHYSDFLAARLVYKLIGYKFHHQLPQ